MSRRAARFTQAELARALAVADRRGPPWEVDIQGDTIRLVRRAPVRPDEVPIDEEPQSGRGLDLVP